MSWFIGLMMIGMACTTSVANQSTSCVIDEATSDLDFVTYRKQVLAALESRQLDRLKPLVWEDVRVGFYDQGWGELVDQHNLANSRGADWVRWSRLLGQGGRFDGPDRFCAPYYSCPPEYLPAGRVAVVVKGVWALAEPKASGTRVRQVSCEVFRTYGEDVGPRPVAPPGWLPVWLTEGRWAFVPEASAELIETYLTFARRNGQWRLAAVLSGD